MASAESPYPGYELVFADEFDVDGLPNPNVWDYEHGFVRNHEDQFYQADNAYVADGCLVIEGRREQVGNPRYEPGSHDWRRNREKSEWTSACLFTKHDENGDGYAWQYGIYEVRAKVPAFLGCWPAIWTVGANGDWPYCGEIDMLEYYPYGGYESILANVAWGGEHHHAIWDTGVSHLEDFADEGWRDEFHVWKMEYTPESIKLYCDDRLLNETDLADTVNQGGPQGAGYNPFTSGQKQFIILNLALGGDHGGDLSATPSPCRYLVDYVRVYQKKE